MVTHEEGHGLLRWKTNERSFSKVHIISFISMSVFPFRKVAGTAAVRELEIPHGFQQCLIFLLVPHQCGTKQGRRCVVTPLALWSTSGSLSCGRSQQVLPRQFSLGHSGHAAKPLLISLYSQKWIDIQGSANFTAAHFVAKCHTVNFSQKSHPCHLR